MANNTFASDEEAVECLRRDPPWEDLGWRAFDQYAGGLATSLERSFAFLHLLDGVELTERTMAMVASGLVDWVITDHGLACEPYIRAGISNANFRYMIDGVMLPEADELAMVESALKGFPRPE